MVGFALTMIGMGWVLGVCSYATYLSIRKLRRVEQVTGTDEELALAYEECVNECRRNLLSWIKRGSLDEASSWRAKEQQARKQAEEYRAKCLPTHSDGAYR